jgi:hypothetical protein
MNSRRPPAAHVRLAKKLAEDPCAILNDALSSFPGIDAHLGHSEDSTRWHPLGARCRQAEALEGFVTYRWR